MATPLSLGLATALATHNVFSVEGDGGVGKRVAALLGRASATGPRHLHQKVVSLLFTSNQGFFLIFYHKFDFT